MSLFYNISDLTRRQMQLLFFLSHFSLFCLSSSLFIPLLCISFFSLVHILRKNLVRTKTTQLSVRNQKISLAITLGEKILDKNLAVIFIFILFSSLVIVCSNLIRICQFLPGDNTMSINLFLFAYKIIMSTPILVNQRVLNRCVYMSQNLSINDTVYYGK